MKKIIALLLTLVMALGLVACGGTTTTTPPDILGGDTTEEPTAGEVIGGSTGEEPGEVLEPWTGDYETATFADIRKYGIGSTNWDGTVPLTTNGEKITIGVRANSYVTDYETNPLTVWLEEATGLTIDVHTFMGSTSDVSTQISLMFNGGEKMPDILYIFDEGNDRRSEYLEAGYLVNLAGYLMTDAHYFSEALNISCAGDPVKYATMLNLIYAYSANQRTGGVYGMVSVRDNPTDVVHTEAMINTEWLQKLGLSKPTTIDELYNVLVAFRDKDPNGNGKQDEIPLMGLTHRFGRGVDHYIINAFIQYSASRKAMIEDGVAFSFHDQDEYRQALIFMNKLVKEGLMSELVFSANGTELRKMLNPVNGQPNTIGICCAWITGDYQEPSNSWKIYEPLPALADATGRGGYGMFDAPTVQTSFGITSSCENVLLAFRLLDFMHSREAYLRQRWGEEGVDWDWIENTNLNPKGTGMYGGDAVYVHYNDGFRMQSRWTIDGTFSDEKNFQMYMDPNATDFANTYFRKAVENVQLQEAAGQPEEQLYVFLRTPEEDELFHEFNSELSSLTQTYKAQFALGRIDPNDDAEWQKYLDDLAALKFERWAELAQASYDRQKAELDAIRERMEK